MALKVIIPLHEDRTVLQDKHQLAADTNLAVECVSFALAKALANTAKRDWPELKCIYIDCMMSAKSAHGDRARFEKKHGELVFGCAVNLKKIHAMPSEAQCLAIVEVCFATLGDMLARRKLKALGDIAAAFHENLTLEFVRACIKEHVHRFPDLQEGTELAKRRKRKPAFRLRVVNPMPAEKGELWLMFRTGNKHDPACAHAVTAHVCALVSRRKIGRYAGASAGAESADISFKVASLDDAAHIIATDLDKSYPNLYFIMSDDYEVVFDV